jgi:hypothetical protein
MGRDLDGGLGSLVAVTVEGAASVLPPTTAGCMAALMPSADGSVSLLEYRGDLAPATGGKALAVASDRKARCRSASNRVASVQR